MWAVLFEKTSKIYSGEERDPYINHKSPEFLSFHEMLVSHVQTYKFLKAQQG